MYLVLCCIILKTSSNFSAKGDKTLENSFYFVSIKIKSNRSILQP